MGARRRWEAAAAVGDVLDEVKAPEPEYGCKSNVSVISKVPNGLESTHTPTLNMSNARSSTFVVRGILKIACFTTWVRARSRFSGWFVLAGRVWTLRVDHAVTTQH